MTNSVEQGRWSFKQPGEGATFMEVMRYGTRREKIEEVVATGAAGLIFVGAMAGPLVASVGYEIAGQVTRNPEFISTAHNLRILEAEIWGATLGVTLVAKGIKEAIGRVRIQKTPEQILIDINKNPKN